PPSNYPIGHRDLHSFPTRRSSDLEGQAKWQGEWMPAQQALAKAGITPIVLAAKEGLALINGTQVSTALALNGLFRTQTLFRNAIDRKSTRLNSSHVKISYAVFCLK